MKSDARRYAIWLLAAVAFHAGLLLGPWRFLQQEATYNVSPDEGIEVSIVDSAPGAPEAVAAPAPAPEPATVEPPPIPPPPAPTPPPPPPEPIPEPIPEPPKPPEKPDALQEPVKPERKPRAERRPRATPARAVPRAARPHAGSNATESAESGAKAGAAAKGGGGVAGVGNSKPAYLSNPHPPYPAESKENHEQGLVMVAVSINERGEVTSASVSRSSGFPRLDQAAREGVSRWRFRPARIAGIPVASRLAVPVRFRLSD